MSKIWTGMVMISILCALVTGSGNEVTLAALEGAGSAVELCLSMAGVLCLWMGIMEVMKRSGLLEKLADILRPILGKLYPQWRENQEIMGYISANVSANLLGLGNAATPLGLQAAKGMSRGEKGRASDALCMLVVCNTASIQLIPTTVASLRTAAGCETAFDILPAIWLASACSVAVGIVAVKVLGWLWRGDHG